MLLASLGGHIATCKWLYEAGCVDEVHIQNVHGNNPMHFACRQGNLEVAKWLVSVQLDDRDDVRLANHQNNTPMHFACRGGHLEVCIWLAAQGASEDVRVANAYGWTPMHSAHWKGHRGIVDWLETLGGRTGIFEVRIGRVPTSLRVSDLAAPAHLLPPGLEARGLAVRERGAPLPARDLSLTAASTFSGLKSRNRWLL